MSRLCLFWERRPSEASRYSVAAIHLFWKSEHYHDMSRYCALFAYFNVRKSSVETCAAIIHEIDHAEECSIAMLADAVFQCDDSYVVKQKSRTFLVVKRSNIGWILTKLPTGMYLLAETGHAVSVDIRET